MGKYGEEKRRDTHANDHSQKRRDSFSSAAAAATLMQIRVDKKNRRFYEGKDPSIICLFLSAALTDVRLSVFFGEIHIHGLGFSSHCEDMQMYPSPI